MKTVTTQNQKKNNQKGAKLNSLKHRHPEIQ